MWGPNLSFYIIFFFNRLWESYGVEVVVTTSDISTKPGCEQVLRTSMKLGPVGGIFNLAVILNDNIFEFQNADKFARTMEPKANATRHLDELSRTLCSSLQYFVVFSSGSCGRGNAGQSNYGMANSVMERIMEQRCSLGFPAKAIQWGAVGDVGLVADEQGNSFNIELDVGGTSQQRISSCLEALDSLLTAQDPIVSSMVVAEKRVTSDAKVTCLDMVMNLMGVRDIKAISLETTLSELGLDSLIASELKHTLQQDYNISLSSKELRDLTFLKVMEFEKS